MLKTAMAAAMLLAGVQSIQDVVTDIAHDQADAYVRPDPGAAGTEWRVPIVDGKFTTHLCQAASDHDQAAFFSRIAERFSLSQEEHDRLVQECAIWSDGHETRTWLDSAEPVENKM